MSKVIVPAKQFTQFIEASTKWLAKTSDFKQGLDVLVEVDSAENLMTMSVGADSSFLKASFATISAPEEGFEKVFLDLSYLAKLPFEAVGEVSLARAKPKAGSMETSDKRIAVSQKTMNYKVPVKNGDVWHKNKHDFKEHEVTTYIEVTGRVVFDTIYRETILPASFGVKTQNLICFHKKEGKEGVFAYTEDGMGAFCHQFKKGAINFSEGSTNIPILYDFFLPIVKIQELQSLRVYSSERYVLGSMKSDIFKSFHWVQPKMQRNVDDIEEFLSQTRKEQHDIIELNTKTFVEDVKNAIVFFKDSNMKDTPLQFRAVENKYSVSAALPTASSLMEGTTVNTLVSPALVFFQAASLRDYLNMLDMDKNFVMEKYSSKVLLVQDSEELMLCYMLPILEK